MCNRFIPTHKSVQINRANSERDKPVLTNMELKDSVRIGNTRTGLGAHCRSPQLNYMINLTGMSVPQIVTKLKSYGLIDDHETVCLIKKLFRLKGSTTMRIDIDYGEYGISIFKNYFSCDTQRKTEALYSDYRGDEE